MLLSGSYHLLHRGRVTIAFGDYFDCYCLCEVGTAKPSINTPVVALAEDFVHLDGIVLNMLECHANYIAPLSKSPPVQYVIFE